MTPGERSDARNATTLRSGPASACSPGDGAAATGRMTQRRTPKAWVTDLEANYRFEKVTFGLGIQNLMDVYPEQVLTQLQPQGVRHPGTSMFGINGRFVYARASLRF